MLVITRRQDEVIKIGDDVEVMVVAVRGDRVRLSVQAPTRLAIHRKEVYDKIMAEHRAGGGAMSANPSLAIGAGPLRTIHNRRRPDLVRGGR